MDDRTKRAGGEDRTKRAVGAAHPVDVFVGGRIRQLRTLKGYTQANLAEAVGLTFQQVQKYESGANRVGASRLFEFSQILGVPVDQFFDGLNYDTDTSQSETPLREDPDAVEFDVFQRRETLDLVRAYYRIENASVRRSIYDLAKSLAPDDLKDENVSDQNAPNEN